MSRPRARLASRVSARRRPDGPPRGASPRARLQLAPWRPITRQVEIAAPDPSLDGQPPASQLAVPVVVGTRPEAIKLVPIILALRASADFRPIVVSTGQHHRMVEEIFALTEIEVEVELWVGGAHAGLNERVSTVIARFGDFCRQRFACDGSRAARPDEIFAGDYPAAVVVHGDTSSAMAAALAAFQLRIPVVHVEAGLRTGGNNLSPFPEELNRQLISRIASFHLAPTAVNQQNLVREGVSIEQVFVTGNTGIDALHWASGLDVPYPDPAVRAADESGARIVVVTAHRRENWNGGLAEIAAGVERLAAAHPEVRFVVPLHPNPLVHERLGARLREIENVILTEPMGYAAFARLLRRCDLVITDSGGIQEEAPSLDKPVLVTRETTERTEGVEAGTLLLVGADAEHIAAAGHRLLTDPIAYAEMAAAPNPYGDGHAAERAVAALEQLVHGGESPHPFGAGYRRGAVIAAAGYEAALHPAEKPADERDVEEHPHPDEVWPT